MNTQDVTEALVELGFTGLEAEVYTALLQQSPSTGYRIAQALGKPVANTYKIIESLHKKGAVIVDEGENRLCRAVPADELLGQMERRFQKNKRRAAKALSRIQTVSADDRVYQLRSFEQVMARCRRMLADSRQIALLDIFPLPLAELRPDIEAAAGRGVKLGLKVYQPTEIERIELFVEPAGESVLSHWPGQWVNIVVDDTEFLLAFLTQDCESVHQAVWSNSAYLSWVYSSALASELIMAGLQQLIEQGVSMKVLQNSLKKYLDLKPAETPGYQIILSRFAESQDP